MESEKIIFFYLPAPLPEFRWFFSLVVFVLKKHGRLIHI